MARESRDGPALRPFAEEGTTVSVGDMTVENRLDRVSLHGSLDLTKDRAGLARARRLRAILDSVVGALEAEDLPDRVEVLAPKRVRNPFA